MAGDATGSACWIAEPLGSEPSGTEPDRVARRCEILAGMDPGSWSAPSPRAPRSGDVRASDAEREAVVDRLRAHFAEGRLDHAELEERVEAAYRAKMRSELDGLLADLPAVAPLQPPLLRRSRRPPTVHFSATRSGGRWSTWGPSRFGRPPASTSRSGRSGCSSGAGCSSAGVPLAVSRGQAGRAAATGGGTAQTTSGEALPRARAARTVDPGT